MTRKPAPAAKAAKPEKPTSTEPQMTGTDRDFPLSKVRPNGWNPNHMSAFMLRSFEQELRDNGWLRSMKILVWGKDEKGTERNLIIDGEHRWKIGRRLGYKVVPMVFMDGLTEAQAKRLTVRIRKQGDLDPDDLGRLLQEPDVRAGMELDTYSLAMGIEEVQLSHLLGTPGSSSSGTQPGSVKRGPKVTLEFSSDAKRDGFKTYLAKLATGEAAKLPGGDLLCEKLRIK